MMSSQRSERTHRSQEKKPKGVGNKKVVEVTDLVVSDSVGRRRGRPSAAESSNISRSSILRAALRLTKTTRLQDLSILMVARSLKVAPGLIHYYIGGRDWLTSGVINLFYRELLKVWPKAVGDWRANLISIAKVMYVHFITYPGVCAYIVVNIRFRIFQLTEFSDRDWGVEFLERFAGLVNAAGLPPDRSGAYSRMLMNMIVTIAHNTVDHIYPAEHSKMIEEKTAQLDPQKYPNILFGREAVLEIDGERDLEESCRLVLLGMATDLAASRQPVAGKTLSEVTARSNGPRRAGKKS